MSDYARNLDTFNDFDEPEYIPEVGDRVKLEVIEGQPGNHKAKSLLRAALSRAREEVEV